MRKWAGGRPNPKCVRIEGRIPQIVDEDTWLEVYKRMVIYRQNARNTAKREYPLSGLIRCEKCGGTYSGHARKNK